MNYGGEGAVTHFWQQWARLVPKQAVKIARKKNKRRISLQAKKNVGKAAEVKETEVNQFIKIKLPQKSVLRRIDGAALLT